MSKSEGSIIGPFLGPRGETGVEIFIALPDEQHPTKDLICRLYENGKEIQSRSCPAPQDSYGLFNFRFKDLDDDKIYKYGFFLPNGEPLDLGCGLTEKDCEFRVLGRNAEDKSFVLMSCHNPFEKEEGSADEGWTVWEQLSGHLHEDKTVRLLVLAGDQLYNDDFEKEFLRKLAEKNKLKAEDGKERILEETRRRFIRQYQRYWSHPSYRKVLASILSVAIWDDHDITDGWGSRPESFDSGEDTGFRREWWKFFEIARDAFEVYQASRNAEPIHKGSFSSRLDWGDKRFVLADFRSERNSQKNQLWSKEHKDAVLGDLRETPGHIKQVFFVSPPGVLRTNFSTDRRMSSFSKNLFKLRRHFERTKPWYVIQNWKKHLMISVLCFLCPLLVSLFNCGFCEKMPSAVFSILYLFFVVILPVLGAALLFWTVASNLPGLIAKIPHLPDLSDDMEDGLSSGSNMESLKEIMECLTDLAAKGKEVFILSGDIHLGGLTEIVDTRQDPHTQILQVVSSPISNKPMPKVVEGLTTTTSEMVIRESDNEKRLFARNIFYTSKRNFVQVFPDKKEGAIAFHFEGYEFPVVFPKRFVESPKEKGTGSNA